jgi:hypothetical protein
MKFEEMLPHLREGKRVRRAGTWSTDTWLQLVDADRLVAEGGTEESWDSMGPQFFDGVDDWELVPTSPGSAGEALYRAWAVGEDCLASWEGRAKEQWEARAQAVIAWHAAVADRRLVLAVRELERVEKEEAGK